MDVELAEIRDFLAQHQPFSQLPADVLNALPGQLTGRYYRRGTTLVAAGQANQQMYVLRSGAVDIIDAHGALVERSDVGTCFGMSSVISGGPSKFTMIAREDSLVLVMPAALFHELIRTQPTFATYFMQQQAGRIRSAVEAVQVADSGGAILKTRVSDIVKRAPITTGPATTIRDAARIMSEHRVSAILVTQGPDLLGIMTDRDLRSKVLAVDLSPGEPVASVMTPEPVTVRGDALAFEVLMEMTQRGVHHLPVVDADGVAGMVTAGDLMRLEQANPVYLVGDIAGQTTLEGLRASACRLGHVVETYANQDASADDIARIVTAVGDSIVRKLLTFAEAELGTPPVHYCWVALGSQARLEQGLGSDQDSAIILADAYTPEHEAYFAALADRVVSGLEACGYPRCPGDMMASNPQWRVPLHTWAGYFRQWINEPDPDALLNAQTFFDMRPVFGDNTLFTPLQDAVTSWAPGSARFLAHLARQQATWEPPIGFFRDFVLEDKGEHRNTLDLKAGGIAAVVQMGRLLALSKGLAQVNTTARLKGAAASGALSPQNAENLADAFEFISYVRIQHQVRQLQAGRAPDNRVNPADLSDFEKRHLRDAFTIVRAMQKALSQVYQTSMFS